MIHLAIRGYANGEQQFEDRVSLLDNSHIDFLLPDLAEKHGHALAVHELHMIEIEFLDEPDPLQRIVRFGSDPSGMILPVHIPLPPSRVD